MPKFIMRLFAGLFGAVLFTAVCAGPVSAATPIDPTGMLTGFVPPSVGVLKCERYVNKRITVDMNCALKCHMKNADALSKSHLFDNSVCEDTGAASCEAKYNRSFAPLDQNLCPVCLNAAAQLGLYPGYHDVMQSFNGPIYCDTSNSVPFADGSGFASMQRDIAKCEFTFARNVNKLIKCLKLKCHRNVVEDLFVGRPLFDEPACEDVDPVHSCKARFLAATANIAGCPPCLDAAHRAQVFDTVQQALDSRNGLVYCGQ